MLSATATSEEDLKQYQKREPLPLINEQDDNNFFSRLLSKDTSMANPSFRVYYGSGAAGSVPFIWESQPGTPKHYSLFSESSLPPLTPPPSSFREMSKNPPASKTKPQIHELPANPNSFFRRLLKKVSLKKSSSRTMIMPETVKSKDYRRRFLSRDSSFDSAFIADADEEDRGSSYFCFQVGKRGSTRW